MTITLTREEAQQVLDALECMNEGAFNAEIKLLRVRLSAPEPSIVEDAIVYGTGITMGGNRIDPASIYKEPEPPCKTGSQCIGGKCPQCVVSEPEPVAWMNESDMGRTDWKVWAHGKPTATMPLYAAPPQREWQGLTDEECDEIWDECLGVFDCLKMTEAKLKEKNT
jgi:hypothetical protein